MPSPTEEPRIFKPGDRFLHYQYDIEAFLGAGASGQVYAVRHRHTGDRFALKAGHLAQRGSATTVACNLAEAQAIYRIRHCNVVRVFDLAVEPDGMVWQLMELLEGQTVGDLLARHGRLSPLYAVDVAIEMAWGLHEAHDHQIIHRDVHPGNVFFTREGEVKILDFSLAKIIPAGIETTRDNRVKGTFPYMAPEHLRKVPPNPQFDVFAVGVTLWQMLTGRRPFDDCADNAMARVQRHLAGGLESVVTAAGLPACCDEVIRGATATDPRARYPNMWPLAQALIALRARLAADPAVRLEPWERRRPIAGHAQGRRQYRAQLSPPRDSPVPHLTARKIVVSPGVAPPPPLAPTVPMAVYQAGLAAVEMGAPTVRGRPPARPRRPWVALAVVAGAALLGAGIWGGLTWEAKASPPS